MFDCRRGSDELLSTERKLCGFVSRKRKLRRDGLENCGPISWGDAPGHGPGVWLGATNLLERFYCDSLVVFYVEDGVEFRDLEQIVNLLGEVEQLQFAALVLGGGEE